MNLDISLFERLVRNNLPYAKLTCQHRMKPRIADLIRPHIYETLTDNKNVMEYEDIRGVDQSVFFISHQHKEDMIVDGKTKINQHEAEFIVALCKYLLLQQYKPSQITILTTYTGQLLALKNIINQHGVELKDVYVTAVDNYQGEENDIILLSLVRSNESRSIGFLKIHNRVCVALSRAKKGLFCIGNMKLLQKESDVWDTIVKSLEEDQLIGSGLTLKCRNHPDTCVLAEYAKDFKKFPEGGCGVACLYRLNCGHSCTRTCHPDDMDHSKFQCMKPCTRSCPLLHQCLQKCWEDCGICPVLMDKKVPGCGHMQHMKCGIEPKDFKCQKPCPIILDCGHQCMDLCGSPCGPCKKMVKKTIPKCGHIQEMKCYVEPKRLWCKSPCNKIFECGHKCPDKCCKSCRDCLVKVEKTMPKCGHQQKIKCYKNPMLFKCKAVCEKQLSCGHQCKGICSQKCPNCQVWVNKKLGCGHDQRLMCSQDVNTVKCQSRCEKMLACGHQCVEKCWNDICITDCLIKVKVNLSCGQEEDVRCLASSNLSKILCKQLCGKTLDCGHKCTGSCLNCLQGRFHTKCRMKCLKKLDCGHMCNGLCSMECPPCSKKCDNSCKHRKCTQICGRPCTRCRSLCTWSCPHLKCTKLCGEACDRPPCNEHCTKILKCGHSCIGLCGEPCPKLCRVCDKQVVAKSLTEDESLATARFVELPKCGHIFTHTILDKLMGVKNDGVKSKQTVKHCPQCKSPILQCVRYGQMLSQTWRDRVFVKPMQKPSPFMVKNQREKYNKTVATNPASSEFIQAAFQLVQRISEKQTKQQLNFKFMKLKYIYRLLEIQTTNIKKMFGGKITQSDVLKRTKEIADTVDFLGRRLLAEKDGYTAQETKEFTNELYRIDSLLK